MNRADFHILIVDDERTVCERLSAELERLGFTVETHMESRQALERIGAKRFNLVITDIKMRGPDGIDITRFVKENHPATKVIVITGFATVDTARKALREGAVEFIPKPFKLSELRELVLRLADESGDANRPP